ncbi:TPA: hypothetical protein DIC20_00630 [Candidatus Dependentiae bacterium]|nr:hypothetical protein [Candidatus Dependentiae bacterium]HCU00191.1 hypothetical protein [Candidatus Dependentiae bacterium]
MQITKQKEKKVALTTKQRTYKEVIALLDSMWNAELLSTNTKKITLLDKALGTPSKKVKAVFVGGSNGKSLTVNYATQLLINEGLKVGSFYSPHFNTYNERIAHNNESIVNTAFTEVANEVINAAASLNTDFHAQELLTMMALTYFAEQKVDAAVLEITDSNFDPAMICNPIISGITRITNYGEEAQASEIRQIVETYQSIIKKGCWVISADQNKANLQTLQDLTEKNNGHWAMPIRKLTALKYPFEQLHGRCAALAERIAQIFVQEIADPKNIILNESLLAKPKGQRGRPTLEAKRQSELNPKKTLEQFWQTTTTTISNRFELIEENKPTILLDNANNIDAFQNLLLGIRLLNYERKFKGLVIIVGCENNDLLNTDFYKIIRYFFKKTTGQIVFCPISHDAQSSNKDWNVEQITNDIKNVKVKARSTTSFTQALDYAKKIVDEENGLIAITGSRALIAEYWKNKGAKK